MKIRILLIIFMSVFYIANGQVQTKSFSKGDAFKKVRFINEHLKANKTIKLSTFDAQKLIDEDKLNEGMARPFRFGKGFDVNISLADGEWTDVENGRLWSMEIQSPDAYSINFVFDKFFLSDNAQLYAINTDGTMLYGPVTSKQNTKNGFFLTDLISGDDVTIYLYEPNTEKGKSKLTIKKIVHAYKISLPDSYGNFNGSYSCNNDINCYPAWDEQSDAVALVLLSDGTEWCSGSLLITAGQTFEPYFLSAFHCIDRYSPYGSLSTSEISDAENWMFKFQYKRALCGENTATTGITYNGATYRAAWYDSDFSLVEMDNSPVGDTQFTWLGWDRSGNTPTTGTGIHHPAGDVMKISFDADQLSSNNTQINWTGGTISPANTHWVVGFDNGTVQGGSSGSPLFDQNSRVIGQLHGGQDGCAPVTKYYGQFQRSWKGGETNTTRLSNWLDPCGSGAMTTNTARSPYLSGSFTICSSGTTYTVNNVPSGATVSWTCSSNISFDHQTGNPKTFTANGTGIGTIQAILISDCGNVTLPATTVWVGIPDYTYLEAVSSWDNETLLACDETDAWALYHGSNAGIDAYEWDMSGASNWNIEEETGIGPDNKYVVISYNDDPPASQVTIRLRAHNACGWSWWQESTWDVVNYNCGGYYLTFSPNPSTSETTISLLSSDSETVQSTTDWDLEVYDSFQGLKEKKTKLKTKETTLNTSGWKDGVYIVRATVGDKVFTGKLLVKH